MRVLLWHVHGSWTTAFVQGRHTYLLPTLPERGPWGLGRARTWRWPDTAVEVPAEALREQAVDVVVLQRPEELELATRWLGRRPGRDVPAVYLEHNTPKGDVPHTVHPVADRDDLLLVHVTAFNQLFWDAGRTRTAVVEHGIVDPGERYTGELPRVAVVVNEPVRRWRVTGTDLLPGYAAVAPLDVFGMGLDGLADRLSLRADQLHCHGDLAQDTLHTALARRRLYLHPLRWTSLGLSLLEAMHLGMPVVALATTEAVEAVPPGAGFLSTDPAVLARAVDSLVSDPDLARHVGKRAREAALGRYGLGRFLDDWDRILEEVTR